MADKVSSNGDESFARALQAPLMSRLLHTSVPVILVSRCFIFALGSRLNSNQQTYRSAKCIAANVFMQVILRLPSEAQ